MGEQQLYTVHCFTASLLSPNSFAENIRELELTTKMAASAENEMDFSVKLNEVNNEAFDDRHLYILQSLTKAFREPVFR